MKAMTLTGRVGAATLAAGILSAGVFASYANAGPAPMPTGFKAEKCFGIAKAGHNDCASAGNNSCAGTSARDGEHAAWIYVPAGTCSKILGASMSPT